VSAINERLYEVIKLPVIANMSSATGSIINLGKYPFNTYFNLFV
jgi:hypothetical protein